MYLTPEELLQRKDILSQRSTWTQGLKLKMVEQQCFHFERETVDHNHQ